MAAGLNYYLKYYCLTTVSWYADIPVEMPDVLPMVEKPVVVEAKVDNRFFLNYCTYGYSMPFWKWKDWERFIDWMALNGVNMPLAITGQEMVWYKVWKKIGLTDEEIRSYFYGPGLFAVVSHGEYRWLERAVTHAMAGISGRVAEKDFGS